MAVTVEKNQEFHKIFIKCNINIKNVDKKDTFLRWPSKFPLTKQYFF